MADPCGFFHIPALFQILSFLRFQKMVSFSNFGGFQHTDCDEVEKYINHHHHSKHDTQKTPENEEYTVYIEGFVFVWDNQNIQSEESP